MSYLLRDTPLILAIYISTHAVSLLTAFFLKEVLIYGLIFILCCGANVNFFVMSYYSRENCSKTAEEHLKEVVRVWNYKAQWLEFVPNDGVPPLSLDDLKDIQFHSAHPFCFAKTADNAVSCDNKHGGLLLLKHGYLPSFLAKK